MVALQVLRQRRRTNELANQLEQLPELLEPELLEPELLEPELSFAKRTEHSEPELAHQERSLGRKPGAIHIAQHPELHPGSLQHPGLEKGLMDQ
jgi:hypothetical protein